jgi:diguanylate cyclase (GGDEF)-like protein
MSGASGAWQRATLTAVSALGAELSSGPRDADDAVLLVCRRSRDLLDADVRFWLGSADGRRAQLTVHATSRSGASGSAIEPDNRSHDAVVVTLRHGVAQMLGAPGRCTTMLLPVAGRAGTVGVLEISASDQRAPFDASDLATGAALAERLASSLLTTRLLDELQHRADHDDLTGLPNRAMLVRHLDAVLESAAAQGETCAVVFIDIDRFKHINDSLGHSAGDDVLRIVAGWLRDQVRAEDLVSRFGGDEFVIVAAGFQDEDELVALLDRITRVPGQALRVGTERLYVSLSAGLARQEDGDDADMMLRHADAAMYHAKSSRARRWESFSGRVSDASVERLRLEADLQDAIAAKEIFCEYQPIVSLTTGEVIAHEALARWMHPTRGRLEPRSFIPLAEESGIILPLTDLVLDQALGDAATWPLHVALAVNLSARHLADPRLAHSVLRSLERHGVDPGRLIVEITETSVMVEPETAAATLARLSEAGIRVSLDDFGSGYTSIDDVTRLPISLLKVDRSLVSKVRTERGHALVSSMQLMGDALGVATVAEGVETIEELALVTSIGCTYVQGFLIGRPVAASDIDHRRRTHRDDELPARRLPNVATPDGPPGDRTR